MKLRFLLVLLLLAMCLAGCGDGGGTVSTTAPSGTIISGSAGKGPFKTGATVSVFKVNADGSLITSWSASVKNDLGEFSVDVGSYTGALEIQVAGTYWDEYANQDKKTNSPLKAIVYCDGSSSTITVNPNIFTTIATEKAKYLMASGSGAQSAINSAYADVAQLLSGIEAGDYSPTLDETQTDFYFKKLALLNLKDLTKKANAKFYAFNYALMQIANQKNKDPLSLLDPENLKAPGAIDLETSSGDQISYSALNSNIATFLSQATGTDFTPVKSLKEKGALWQPDAFSTTFSIPSIKKAGSSGLFKFEGTDVSVNVENKPLSGEAVKVEEKDGKVFAELVSSNYTYGYVEGTKDGLYMFVQPVDSNKMPLETVSVACDTCNEEIQVSTNLSVASSEKPVPKTLGSSDGSTKVSVVNMKLKKDVTVAVTPYKSAKYIPKVDKIGQDTGLSNLQIISGADVMMADAWGTPTSSDKVCFCGDVSIATTHTFPGVSLSDLNQKISSGDGQLILLVFKNKKWQKVKDTNFTVVQQTGGKYSLNQTLSKTLRLYPFVIAYYPKSENAFSGTITGKVTENGYTPIKGALVTLENSDIFAVSDSSGNYTITYSALKAQEPVTLILSFNKPGYKGDVGFVQVSSSNPNKTLGASLSKILEQFKLQGSVKDTDSKQPIGGATVTLYLPVVLDQVSISGSTVTVGEDKNATYSWQVTDGNSQLCSSSSNYTYTLTSCDVPDGTYYLNISVTHSKANETFVESQKGIVIKNSGQWSIYIKPVSFYSSELVSITDKDGKYEFEGLDVALSKMLSLSASAPNYAKSSGISVTGNIQQGILTFDLELSKTTKPPQFTGYWIEDFEKEAVNKNWTFKNNDPKVGWQVLKNPEQVKVAPEIINQVLFPDRKTLDVEGKIASISGSQGFYGQCKEFAIWPMEDPPQPEQPAIPTGIAITPANGGFYMSWTPVEGVYEYLLSITDGNTLVSTLAFMQPGSPYYLYGTVQDYQEYTKTLNITNEGMYQVKLKSWKFQEGGPEGGILSNYSSVACVMPLASNQALIQFTKQGAQEPQYLVSSVLDVNQDGSYDVFLNDLSTFEKAQYHLEPKGEIKVGGAVTVSYPDPNDTNVHLLPAYSGNYVLWYGNTETGTISDQASNTSTKPNSGEAISPLIDLTGFNYVTAILHTWYEVESVDVAAGQYDQMEIYVGIFDDNKADGEPITITYGTTDYVLENNVFYYLGDLNPETEPPGMQYPHINFSSGGVNEPPIWVTLERNLSPFAGHKIKFKFTFYTKDALYNGFRGWGIDDLIIQDKKSNLPFSMGSMEYQGQQLYLQGLPQR